MILTPPRAPRRGDRLVDPVGFQAAGPTMYGSMKRLIPVLVLAALGAGYLFATSDAPHRTRPDHGVAPSTLASPARPGEVVRNLAVEGMCCKGCAGKLHAALLEVDGVREAAVDFERATALARVDESVDAAALEAALRFDKYTATARPLAVPNDGH